MDSIGGLDGLQTFQEFTLVPQRCACDRSSFFLENLKMLVRYLPFNDTLNEICDQGLTEIRFEYELMTHISKIRSAQQRKCGLSCATFCCTPSHVLRQPLSWLNKIRIGLETVKRSIHPKSK